MADPNLQDFYARVARIESARARGLGFEAEGTLGRSHYLRHRRSGVRLRVLPPVLVAAVCVVGLKGLIHYHIGDGVYAQRVEALAAGQGVDKLGAWLMAADPATLWLSDRLQHWAPR